jgi:hypothetical protein
MSVSLPGTKVFVRDDGARLPVIAGFRERVRSAPKVSVQPKEWWGDDDYEAAAETKLRGFRRRLDELSRWGASLEGASVLEVGCGAGIDSLLFALHPVERVVGIDLEFPLKAPDAYGERTRRLMRRVLEKAGVEDGIARSSTRGATPAHDRPVLLAEGMPQARRRRHPVGSRTPSRERVSPVRREDRRGGESREAEPPPRDPQPARPAAVARALRRQPI